MRIVLCCGDRNWDNASAVLKVLRKEHERRPITYLIEGGQKSATEFDNTSDYPPRYYGADYQARQAAIQLGIQVIECPALWEYHGKKAGPIRNQMQLNLAVALIPVNNPIGSNPYMHRSSHLLVIAFHSDLKNSKGTKDMVNRARKAGVKVKVIE